MSYMGLKNLIISVVKSSNYNNYSEQAHLYECGVVAWMSNTILYSKNTFFK